MGPGGLVDHNYMELTSEIIDEYRNTGGFDIIGSGRTKLEEPEQQPQPEEIVVEEKRSKIAKMVLVGSIVVAGIVLIGVLVYICYRIYMLTM